MATRALIVLLALGAPVLADGLAAALERAFAGSGVSWSGLGAAAGRAGAGPSWSVGLDTPRIPASNQKVLTAAAALKHFGPRFRFVTTIATTEAGDLVVIGDGDPNFSGRFHDGDPTKVVRRMAKDIRARGVSAIKTLWLDASRFDDVTVHPAWPTDQLDRWYCAPVAALVFNDSCWDIRVAPGPKAGTAATIHVQPSLLAPALVNRCDTVAGGRHVVHLGRADRGADFEVRGRILLTSRGIEGHVTVRDPVLFFGRALRAALEAEGVRVDKVAVGAPADKKTEIVAYRSSLRKTLGVVLKNSQNLYSECVFKRMGAGSFESAAKVVTATLKRHGVPVRGLDVQDGSGLARTNKVSARTLYATLQMMRTDAVFTSSLPTGGEGTLRRRYRDLGARVRAKTGTIRGVTTLSGYVTGRDGGRYVFVVLANGKSVRNARKLMDRIVAALARQP